MSAPTPAPGDESPHEGYYPDPSIPGYVRYWNGASWVPGTSRPAPQQGEPMPATSSGAAAEPQPQPSAPAPAPVDETGPVFLDEEPYADNRPEPATAWQADASRQTGFGGERDRRVSWGGAGQPGGQGEPGRQSAQSRPPSGPEPGAGSGSGPESGRDPRTSVDRAPADRAPAVRAPADRAPAVREPVDRAPAVREPVDRAPADPRRPAAPDPTGGALPGMRDGRSQAPESTVAIRAVGRGGRPPAPRTTEQEPAGGTMAIRAFAPGTGAQPPAQAQAQTPSPAQSQAPTPAQTPAPAPAELNSPLTPGPGGGAASWAQQVHQLAQPDQAARPQPQQHQPHLPLQGQQPHPQPGAQGGQPDQPVVPWKPPVNDPFQQLAQAQASARPAGLGRRFAARLVDTVVLAALVGAIGFPLVSRAMDHIDEKISAAKLSGETVTVWLVDSTTAGLFGGVLGAFLVLGVLLEALPTAKWGRTLGKKLCGLDVRDIESHEAPSFGAALRRWLVYGVLGVLVVGVVNVLWCLFDRPWRQCWHDKAAHTFVAG
ncbi:RDD family protein [Streptomyces atratus]|uniref:RDD family protein n=1 Tax=Streptomyces atratus TaxID=1893 RepID=UPI002254298B|nr:RDD family protein [Streptomyces atratus]MCX5343288.1 RDD family protein [Streptomyces atratus]